MDRHRHAELARLLEQRVQPGIVDGQQGLPVGRREAEAEALGDLEAARAEPLRLRELGGHRRAVVLAHPHELEVGRHEHGDASAARRGGGELGLEHVARRTRKHAGQVDHAVDAPFVHQAHGARDAVGTDVRVDVDAAVTALRRPRCRRRRGRGRCRRCGGCRGAVGCRGGGDGRSAPAPVCRQHCKGDDERARGPAHVITARRASGSRRRAASSRPCRRASLPRRRSS